MLWILPVDYIRQFFFCFFVFCAREEKNKLKTELINVQNCCRNYLYGATFYVNNIEYENIQIILQSEK